MPVSPDRATQRKWWVISAVGIAVMCAIATWWGLSANANSVTANQAGFRVVSDDRVKVSWDVVPSRKKPVTCTLIAMNDNRDVLGTKVVNLAKSPYTSTRYDAEIRTTSRAVTGTVKECHYTGDRAPNQ